MENSEKKFNTIFMTYIQLYKAKRSYITHTRLQCSPKHPSFDLLIRSLEWWNSLAFGFIECVADDLSVTKIDLSVR